MLSNLRFTLNAARSPVNKLPPEVLSRIFACLGTPGAPRRCYPPDNVSEISNESLTTVNLVCRYWRKTTIGAKDQVTHIATAVAPDFDRQSGECEKRQSAGREELEHPADPNLELEQRPRGARINDFEMVRVIGKGCASKVSLIRHKATSDLLALKVVEKGHVLACREFLTEQAILKWMADEGKDPFVVKLWWSLRDREHLFMAMDFHPGGDLATQLAHWGSFGRDRARFYAAEIVEGVEGLHKNGIIYRDLKPESVLIASDGHIILTDFGLSKQFPRRPSGAPRSPNPDSDLQNGIPSAGTETTGTFCGTAEYLAPETITNLVYSFEVDWWSFGTILYEMLVGNVCTLSNSLGNDIR